MVNVNIKDAQRQALADAVKEYQEATNSGGNKVPRYRMVKRHPRWMSMTSRNPQRVLRWTDLVTN